jgi:hypothetical protein
VRVECISPVDRGDGLGKPWAVLAHCFIPLRFTPPRSKRSVHTIEFMASIRLGALVSGFDCRAQAAIERVRPQPG